MSEKQELEQGFSAARLSGRMAWGSVMLLFAFLIPYEVINGSPQFIWNVWGELSPAAKIAALALSLAGVMLLAVSRWITRAADQAALCFAAFAGVLALSALGAEASAWDAMSVPDALGDRPALLLLPFACAGAGATLIGRGEAQLVRARLLLWASLGLCTPLYLIPFNGVLPIEGVFELVVLTLTADDVRFRFGYGMIAFTALLPLLVGGLAALLALHPPKRELVVPPLLMTFALPLMLSLFVMRQFFITLGDSSVISSALGLTPLIAGLGVSAAALEVLVAGTRPQLKTLAASGVSLLILSGGMWALSRPPEKGVDWALKPSSNEADALFGERLRQWNVMRRNWAVMSKARREASAKEYVEARKSGTDLIKDATKVNPAVAVPLRDLVFETRNLDLAGRRWFRLIHELNDTNQELGLPYYVDPTVDVIHRDGAIELLFDLQSYRIESVHPYVIADQPFATLHVRALGKKRRHHSLLGFSRDLQPFAVVSLDVLEPYAEELAEWSQASPPTCFDGDPHSDSVLEFCGAQLTAISTKKSRLLHLATSLTDRHELQHQMDGPQLPIATRVNDRMGPYFSWARDDVNRELSAHLAEVTAESGSAHLSLLQLFGNAYRGSRRGKYTLASIMALEGLLGRQLHEAGGPDQSASQREIFSAYKELAVLSDEALKTRAADAWKAAYGEELPKLISRKPPPTSW